MRFQALGPAMYRTPWERIHGLATRHSGPTPGLRPLIRSPRQRGRGSPVEVFMPSRSELVYAHARLQSEMPISDDVDLLKLQEQAAEYVREAKRRDPSGPDELVSTALDAIARIYVGHLIRKQRRRAGKS
jgi:hypothetical protein